MNSLLLALWLAPCAALHAQQALSSPTQDIPRNVSAAGGQIVSGGGFILDDTISEIVADTMTGGGFSTSPGLMQLIAQPGTITSIVAVSKDTGTIDLSWSAPGLDGFVGSVLSGFWRIDSSSDPAHVFSPETYVTEIATSVLPGTSVYYNLTGLLPDTTYYSRVYLADIRKVVAETSPQDNDSTLAHLPAVPVFSGVFPTSVTISWNLPVGGSQGYLINSSSTDFGALTPGGLVVSSQTPNGLVVTLTVTGLNPDTTYYFNLGSLNWQGQTNFNTVMSTLTQLGSPVPIYNLAVGPNNIQHSVTLTWSNPAFANPAGVTILVSTNPISAAPVQGTGYALGTVFPDGSVVESTGPSAAYTQAAMTLDTTGYFSLFSRNTSNMYSIAVTTFVVLDLPPMAPAGLSAALNTAGSTVTLSWFPVQSKLDGSGFKIPGAPQPFEFNRYQIYRSTGIIAPNWVYVGSAPVNSLVYVTSVPVPGEIYYYQVASLDGFQSGTDKSMVVDTSGNLYALDADQVTRLEIPANVASTILPSGNSSGQPLLIRADDRPQDWAGSNPYNVVKSVSFDAFSAPLNRPVVLPPGATPSFIVALYYDVAAGLVAPSAVEGKSSPAAVLSPPITAGNAETWLSAYYVDGQNAAKLFGNVDTLSQTVQVQAPYLGDYQIRAVARTQDFSFDLSGISNRFITPNGDGLNDTVVFTFNNPQASAVTGQIFDMRGRQVATMNPGPVGGNSLIWDAKANGRVVPGGTYIYRIQAEGKTFSGTVFVIK